MKLPRDVSGNELARKLERYGYTITRSTGSHLRLTSQFKGTSHHITIPSHDYLRVGTFNAIINDVAGYLEIEKDTLLETLFN